MSEQTPEDNQELAKVLNRINALMQHHAPETEAPDGDDQIPLLTEIYEGEPLVFSARSLDEFPALRQIAGYSENQRQIPPEVIEILLQEMNPVIKSAVKAAVEQELEKSTQMLCAKLEVDLIQSLRKRLQSNLEIRGI
jgi:hypothetical protein